MKFNRALLDEAIAKNIINSEQAENLWLLLEEKHHATSSFQLSHVLYYLGGMIAIGAMSLFMTLGWENFGGLGIFNISLVYAAVGLWLTEFLLKRQRLIIPAGITATFVVVLTPLAIYGLQLALDLWAEGRVFREYHTRIDWRWLFMELATLATGAILLWRYALSFLVMPIAVTLWYMSMDLTPFLFGIEDSNWEMRKFVSLWFGLFIVCIAVWVDIRTRRDQDFAFWFYLFGVFAFWGGLSMMTSDSEVNKFIYLCINVLMVLGGSIIQRRVFTVFGGLGITGYLGHLAYDIFQNSLFFPFVLTLIGFGIVFLGILWQRYEEAFSHRLRTLFPNIFNLIER